MIKKVRNKTIIGLKCPGGIVYRTDEALEIRL